MPGRDLSQLQKRQDFQTIIFVHDACLQNALPFPEQPPQQLQVPRLIKPTVIIFKTLQSSLRLLCTRRTHLLANQYTIGQLGQLDRALQSRGLDRHDPAAHIVHAGQGERRQLREQDKCGDWSEDGERFHSRGSSGTADREQVDAIPHA